MNCAYRLIWNERINAWSVVPEIAKARGKGGAAKRSAAVLLLTLACASHAVMAADLAATTLPGGAQVTAGQATVSTSGASMAISQSSQRAIINWQNFDIGSQAQVNFLQPNASAVALNRVSGPTASRIEGQLNANGQVFLVNPNGVLFGAGARVNVGALAVSTLNIRDEDFLGGNYLFTGSGGSITNQGQISAAPGGYLAFISPVITNSGTLSAPQGTVAMGAGERVRLNFAGDRLVGLDVSADTIDTLITNSQAIRAEGGTILLTAAGAEAVTRSAINNTGVLEAGSLARDGGRIVLKAAGDITLGATSTVAVDGPKGGEITLQAQSGTLLADGRIAARGAAGTGGTVRLLGHQVGLVNAAQVDASGTTGGGTVLVGGDYQGSNAGVQNAAATFIASDVRIAADALQQGNGGKVIVWADGTTRYFGNISADGAGTGGNGGFVETSGKETLVATGQVSARAPNGLAGTWLLDPNNITIQATGSNTNVTASPNFTSTNDNAIVTTGSIQTALNAGTSVAVTTGSGGANSQPGNITVASAIAKTAGGNATLTLNAANNIVFNTGANVTSTAGALGLTLNAGGAISTMRSISLNGGTLTLNATGAVTQASAITGNTSVVKNGAGTFTLSQNNTYTGATTINAGTLQVGAGGTAGTLGTGAVIDNAALVFNRSNALTVANTISGTGTVTKSGTGTTTLTGTNTYTGTTTINAGTLQVGAGGTSGTLGTGQIIDNAVLSFNRSDALAVANVISGTGALTKAGTGALTLSGTNAYAGATTVSAGTLVAASNTALGSTAGGTTVATGATLALQGDIAVGAETLTITGTGVGNNGALRNLSGNNTWGGTVRLSGNAEIQSDAGTLTLSAANAVTNATATARSLTVDGSGNTAINGTITTTTGTLTKNGSGTLSLSGVNTYTGTTTINAGTLRYGANNAINSGAVVVNNGGTYDLNGYSDTIGALTVNSGTLGGTVTTGSGTLTLGGNVTSTGGGTNAVISGNLNLGAANRTVTTTNAADGLTISAVISGPRNLTKAGAGTLTLAGANTYTGVTTVSAGTLAFNSIANVGGGASALGTPTTAANGTIALAGGATLQYTGSGHSSNRVINLTSSGGTIDASGSGTLTLSGGVTGAARNLILTGSGNSVESGVIGTTTGTLTKNGTGTWTLSGANAYAGATTINGGTLVAASNAALGTTAGGTTVANGATLELAGGIAIGAEALNLGGALQVASGGSASYAGAITLTGSANIGGNGGLTVGGAVNSDATPRPLTQSGTGTVIFAAPVGATNPLASLITGAGQTTRVNGGQVRTTGNQVYGGNLSLGAPTTLATTANGSIIANGSVAANGHALTLAAGLGNVVMQHAGNDFATVSLTSAANVALRDANAIDLGASTIGANLAVTAGGTVTDSGALSVAGATTINAGAGNDVTLDNLNDFAGNVSLQSGRNVRLNDINSLTLDSSSLGTLTATAGGTLTLAGALNATGMGDAIILSGSRFVNNAGAGALSAPGGRWLVWSSNPNPFGGVTADNRGGLVYGFKQYNAIFGVTPVAQPTANGFLYSVAPAITPALTGTVSKVFDGNTTATLTAANLTASGAVDGDTLVLAGGATYDNRNIGTGKMVTATGITATASNGAAAVYGYTVSPTSATGPLGEITPAPLTVTSIAAVNTTYGTPAATGAVGLSGVIGGDVVTSTAGIVSPTYSTSGNLNAGSYAQNASSLSGADAGNYTLAPYTTPTANYTVGRLVLTGTAIAAAGTTYRLPLNPGAVSFGNAIGSDIVGSTASVNTTILSSSGNPVVGNYTQTAGTLTGADAGNYSFSGYTTPTANYTITPLALTVTSIAAVNTTYGTPAATGAVGLSGVIGGDVVTSTAGIVSPTYSTSGNLNAGSYAQNASSLSGADAGNYTLAPYTTPTANYTVGRLALTGGVTAGNKIYDGTTVATIASRSLAGVVGADDVSYAGGTASFADRNVGAGKAVTASGLALTGADAGNYTVNSTAGTTADITARPITVTAVTHTKVYDGTTSAAASPGITGGSLAAGDAANFTQHYADRNAGTGKTLIAAGAVNDGNGGANYLVTFVDDTTGIITPKALTLAAATDTKAYDGSTASSGTVTASGLVGGDTLSGLSQRFASKNVLGANGSTLQVNAGYVVSDGNGGANYTVTTNTAPGTITPASLVITADDKRRPFGVPNPPFTASYAGFVAGETAAVLGGALSFLTTATTSSAPGGYAITPFGQTSGNYAMTYVDGTLTVVGTVVQPGGGGEIAADQQAIGAQYTSRGMPDDVLTRIRYVFGDDGCAVASAANDISCAVGNVVRVVNQGVRLPLR